MHTSSSGQQVRSAAVGYPDQFTTVVDPLEILVPRQEIFAAMLLRGEEPVLDEVCMAVALCADALTTASDAS